MKAFKIIIGIFCFALIINAFNNGINPNESFAYHLPLILLFIIGILLFRSAFKSKKEN